MKRKGKLSYFDNALGGVDDSFYIAEEYLEKTGGKIGEVLGLTPKQAKRKNKLLSTVKELESKTHSTHSTIQRNKRYLSNFQKPLLDTKLSKLKKVAKKFPIRKKDNILI